MNRLSPGTGTQRSGQPRAPGWRGRATARRWLLAGFLGTGLAVVLAIQEPLGDLGRTIWGLMSVTAGWLTLFLMAPWSELRRRECRDQALRGLTRHIQRISEGRREHLLRDLVEIDDQELAALAQAVQHLSARMLATTLENRTIQRTRADHVRRETSRATARLRREAATDPLTGLGNRRALERRVEALLQSSRTSQHPIMVMMIDIDHFKLVNDKLGHEVGDRCLAFLGQILASCLRRGDAAARLGGDEFMAVLPGASRAAARTTAGRLASLFGQMPWSHRHPAAPTLSIGLAAVWAEEVAGVDDLIRLADAALYEAKRAGRARIVELPHHPGPAGPPPAAAASHHEKTPGLMRPGV